MMRRTPLKPSTKPMKRSAIRIKPDAARLTVTSWIDGGKERVAKSVTRTCKNRACRNKFTPTEKHPFAIACCTGCEIILAKRVIEKRQAARAKKERKELAERKEALMPIKKQLKLTEAVINRYVRLRDYHEGCCSCDKPSHWDGQWHASHFKSVGSNSLLRFHLWNIHKGCSECNRHKAGNVVEYTERIRLRFGDERVEWLEERKNGTKKYTAEYLVRMRAVYSKKCRRLEKRLGVRQC